MDDLIAFCVLGGFLLGFVFSAWHRNVLCPRCRLECSRCGRKLDPAKEGKPE